MAADDLAALGRLREQLSRQFIERMRDTDAPLPELRDLQERLRLLDAALADPADAARRRRRAAWLAITAVAALLSVGALTPMPRVPFTLDAEASAIRLLMPQAGELGPQAMTGDVIVDGFGSASSPDAALAQQAQAAGPSHGRVVIRAATLNLRRVSYPPASTLDFAADARSASVAIHSPQSPIGIGLEFAGPTRTRFGSTAAPIDADYPFAEWLQLAAGDPAAPQRAAPPMTIAFAARTTGTELSWQALQATEVRFIERGLAEGNDIAVVSSLKTAKIQLPSSDAEVQLAAGDQLELAGLELAHSEVVQGPALRVKLTGTASTLTTRTGAFERSLKPSVLEYAARHKTVALLWSAALLLWGAMRWLQRLARDEA